MPDSRLHPFWRLVLCAVVLLVAVAVVQAVGVGLLLAFAKPLGFGNLPLSRRITDLATNYALHLTVLSYPIGAGVLYIFRTKVDKYSWRSLGFSRVRAFPDLVRGALTAFLTLSALFALMYVTGAIRFGGWSSDVQTHSGLYAVGSLLFFAVGFGSVGFFEELVFRGYALANLRQFLGWGAAVVVQAAFFAFIHLGNGLTNPEVFKAALAGLPSIFLIAIFFALSYRKTGSLWFPIGFHMAWDWLLGCVFSSPVSGIPIFHLFDVQETSTFLSGGAFGAESSFFLIPLLLAMIYALWLVPDHPRAVANLDRPETMAEFEQTPLYAPYSAPVPHPFHSPPACSRSLHLWQPSCGPLLRQSQRLTTLTTDARVSSATLTPETVCSKLVPQRRGELSPSGSHGYCANPRLTLPYLRTAHASSTFLAQLLPIAPVDNLKNQVFGPGAPFLPAPNAVGGAEVATGSCTFVET